jgi:hypothetical protein
MSDLFRRYVLHLCAGLLLVAALEIARWLSS